MHALGDEDRSDKLEEVMEKRCEVRVRATLDFAERRQMCFMLEWASLAEQEYPGA